MSHSAASLVARCTSVCSVALDSTCPGVLRRTCFVNFKAGLAVGDACTRQVSGGPAAEAGPSCTSSVHVSTVRGVGLKQTLKATPSADLRILINRTTAYEKVLSQSKAQPSPMQTEEVSQWTQLSFRVVSPYAKDEIVLKDGFAVIEAGPTQYKGGLWRHNSNLCTNVGPQRNMGAAANVMQLTVRNTAHSNFH